MTYDDTGDTEPYEVVKREIKIEERTCQNCNNYGKGGYNFPCNECRQSGEWWAPIEYNKQ